MAKKIKDDALLVINDEQVDRLMSDPQLSIGDNFRLVSYPVSATPEQIAEIVKSANTRVYEKSDN